MSAEAFDAAADRAYLGDESEDQLKLRLRIAKRRAALAIGLADISESWTLERITSALSDFASEALGASCRFLLRQMHDRGDLTLPNPEDPENDSGLIVLGMGKLGARELNIRAISILFFSISMGRILKNDCGICLLRFAPSR